MTWTLGYMDTLCIQTMTHDHKSLVTHAHVREYSLIHRNSVGTWDLWIYTSMHVEICGGATMFPSHIVLMLSTRQTPHTHHTSLFPCEIVGMPLGFRATSHKKIERRAAAAIFPLDFLPNPAAAIFSVTAAAAAANFSADSAKRTPPHTHAHPRSSTTQYSY